MVSVSARSIDWKTVSSSWKPSGRRPTTRSSASGVDRNALLRALFPNGIPPREEVIAQANAWLDEAERLTQLRSRKGTRGPDEG